MGFINIVFEAYNPDSALISAALFQINQLCPCVVLEPEHFVGAPVDRVNFVLLAVRNSGNREWEAIDGHLHSGLGAYARDCVEC